MNRVNSGRIRENRKNRNLSNCQINDVKVAITIYNKFCANVAVFVRPNWKFIYFKF